MRWLDFREDYQFTGKEDDVEVGLQYFGKRFLNPYLGRWCSADPLSLHDGGDADLNLYSYVRGMVLKAIDPAGLQDNGQCYAQPAEHAAALQRVQAAEMRAQAEATESLQSQPTFDLPRPGGSAPPMSEGDKLARATQTGILSPVTVTLYALTGDREQFMRTQELNANVTEMGTAAAMTSEQRGQMPQIKLGPGAGPSTGVAAPGQREVESAIAQGTSESRLSDQAQVVRGGIATPEQIAKGIGPHRDVPGLVGFSAQAREGASVEELAAKGGIGEKPFRNGKVSVSTVGQLRCIGCDVVPSPGAGANHVTVTPGGATPAQISEQFTPRPNPAKK